FLSLSQKIEIAPQVGLGDVFEKHAAIPAIKFRSRWSEILQPAMDLLRRNTKLDLPAYHVELDFIAVLNDRQGSAQGRFGSGVQHHGPKARATHSRIADPHHVRHALLEQDLGHRDVAPL